MDKALEKKKVQFKRLKIDNEKADKNTGDVVEIEEESPDPINIEIEYDDEGKGNEFYKGKEDSAEKNEIISNILCSDNVLILQVLEFHHFPKNKIILFIPLLIQINI